jgi:phospholipid/cholesterol/gamma-HCH transport system substrate-binding protein
VSLARQIRRNIRALAAVLFLVACAAAVGAYVLAHQRLHFPWQSRYALIGEFSSAQAVTPGQGQTVTVAGVKVGDITAVNLRNGVARVTMEIDPGKLPAVHTDARMLLRPKTGLQDMSIELDPGSDSAPRLPAGGVLPVARTLPSVNMDEVLAGLDADTRDWLVALVDAGATGLHGRGVDLRAILKAGAPTLQRTRQVTQAILGRRRDLATLVSDLRTLGDSVAGKDRQLATLVDSGDATLTALARHDAALDQTLRLLPATINQAHKTLLSAQPFAQRLGPALTALSPAVRRLAPAAQQLDPLLRDALPAAQRIRRLSREAQPVAADLGPTLGNLSAVTPRLSQAFRVLQYVTNELGYNPPGSEEGYLFWTAWFAHNAASLLSLEDAQGTVWRGALLLSCSSYAVLQQTAPLLAGVLTAPVCPKDASG